MILISHLLRKEDFCLTSLSPDWTKQLLKADPNEDTVGSRCYMFQLGCLLIQIIVGNDSHHTLE